jgi:pimeloyl-ACP methyl ester carboxylesterase
MTEPRLLEVACLHNQALPRMAYWEWGDAGAADVLLCLHGLTRQGRDFDTLARAMAGRYRVVCPDVIGRGRSEWLADPMGYALPHYVAHMVTLLARLDLRHVDVVGTSMGGLIGLGLASLAGSPVRKLVLNDVGPVIEAQAIQRIGSYIGQPAHWPSEATAAAALRAISTGFGPHTDVQWLELTRPQLKPDEQRGGFMPRCDPAIAVPFKAITPALASLGEAALWQAYDNLRCPTLLLRGADSDLLSHDTALAMTRRGPRASLHEFAGVGHAPTLVQDDQIEVVRRFLSSP